MLKDCHIIVDKPHGFSTVPFLFDIAAFVCFAFLFMYVFVFLIYLMIEIYLHLWCCENGAAISF